MGLGSPVLGVEDGLDVLFLINTDGDRERMEVYETAVGQKATQPPIAVAEWVQIYHIERFKQLLLCGGLSRRLGGR